MKKTLTILLLALLAGCATKKSEVATQLGYDTSSKVTSGPYQLDYAKKGPEEFMLLSKGNYNLLSKEGEATSIFLDGRPFISFERNADGSLTNVFMYLRNSHRKETMTLIDKDGDGQWDKKIDHVLKKIFVWKDGLWAEPPQSQPSAAPNGGPATPRSDSGVTERPPSVS